MSSVEKIKDKLQNYPRVRFDATSTSITVLPESESGFSVSLVEDGNERIVFFNGGHEHFSDEEEALNFFSFGLSRHCRLKEFRRGKFAYKWVVEQKIGDEWTFESVTALLFFPFWRKKEVRVLQNNLVP